MQPNQQIIQALGRIGDATLVGADEPKLLQEAYRALAFSEWEGLVLRAPASVDLDGAQGLPVLAAWRHGASREREVVLGDNALVIANLVGGKGHWVTPLFPPQVLKVPKPGRRPPPKTDGAATPAGSMGVRRLELKSAGGVPWRAGRYALRIISYDWVSNTVATVLTGPQPPVPPGQSAEDRLATWSARGRGTPGVFPNFGREPRTPTLSAAGIALSQPTAPIQRGGPIPVYGVVRLPVGSGWQTGRQTPASVEDAFFVLVRRGILGATVLDIEVPIWVPAGTGALAEGCFAYDLRALAGERLQAGRWQIYAVAGDYTAGPVTLDLAE